MYSKLTAEPFERGYGVTVGNGLRLVLLSSIEGTAVTAVRIDGANARSKDAGPPKSDFVTS